MTRQDVVDQRVLARVAKRGPCTCVSFENAPPRGCTSAETRAAFQRLVVRGELVLDAQLKLALPGGAT